MASRGGARYSVAFLGVVGWGAAWHGVVRFGMVNLYTFLVGIGQVRQGSARSGLARFGGAVLGWVRHGVVWLALPWSGVVCPGMVRHGRVGRDSVRLCLAWLLCGGLQAAQITLTVDPPLSTVSAHRIYIGTSPGAYFAFVEFPDTNQFLISVTNNKVYLACSAVSYELGESDLSEEITVQLFSGWVQLGDSPTGPWTNYLSVSVPIEITEPARFVRVRLE